VIGGALLAAVGWRALRTFIPTRRTADLLVVCGLCLLVVSLGAALSFEAWTVGWWAGHALEFAGIGLVGIPVAADFMRSSQSRPLAGDLDVYDALISKRVYRGAWTPGEAFRALTAEEGSSFDGRCVAALERVIRNEHPVTARLRVPARARVSLAHGPS
jgi:hypothetical protein